MRSTGLRRSIAVLLTGLVAALLPLAGPAAPAHAVAGRAPPRRYETSLC